MWVDGVIGDEEIRKRLGTCDWQKAQEMVRDWEAEDRAAAPKRDEPMTIVRALEHIVADATARGLRQDTIAKYKLLSRELEQFAHARTITTFADFDLPEILAFRATWKNSNLGALKKLERLRGFFRFARDNGWVTDNLVSCPVNKWQ